MNVTTKVKEMLESSDKDLKEAIWKNEKTIMNIFGINKKKISAKNRKYKVEPNGKF